MANEVGVFSWPEHFEDSFEGIAAGIEASRVDLLEQALDPGGPKATPEGR